MAEQQAHASSAAEAVKWAYVMNIVRLAALLIVTLVLARILGPRAFGIVTLASAYLFFLQLIQQAGLESALIQRPDLTKRHQDAAFWMVLGGGVVMFCLSVLGAPLFARLNGDDQITDVVRVMSVLLLIRPFSLVQDAALKRQLRMRDLARRTAVASFAGGTAGLVAGVLGAGVYALVIQQIVEKVADVVMLWRFGDWRPSLSFDWQSAKDLLGFSTGSAIASVGAYLTTRADALLIGAFFGPSFVGIYRIAQRLVEVCAEITARSVQPLVLPMLAPHVGDHERLSRRLTSLIRIAFTLSAPLLALLSLSAPLLPIVLGQRWADAVVGIPLLSLAAVGYVGGLFTVPALQAMGRTMSAAAYQWVSGIMMVGALAVAGVVIDESLAGSVQVALVAGVRAVSLLVFVVPLNVWVVSRATAIPGKALVKASAEGMWLGVVVAGVGAPVYFGLGQVTASWQASAGAMLVAATALAWLVHRRDLVSELRAVRGAPMS